ncbi:MAG: alpha/beta fold hydrolase [Pseudomonadota bacterium]|nr:alpha/beta fold hydrolase [Pseudomonadota bacterium]
MNLAYDSVGRGAPVLVLHGLFGSSVSWRGVARALADHHRVISVDLRNHGDSPASGSMDYVAMAEDVLTLLTRLGIGCSAVLGHCIGGKVAMAMALLAPRAVGTLCLVESAPVTFLDPWTHQLRSMRRGLAVNGGSAALLACRAAANGTLLSRFALPRHAVSNDYVDWRSNLAAIAPHLQALRDFPSALQDRRSELPVEVFLGADSAFVRPADATAFLPMFPNVRIQVFEGSSHWPHAACPEELLDGLRAVLEPVAA